MTMENLIGSTLQNRFKVLSFVASGGMSTVFRVRDTQRNVTLAMKVLHLDLMDDPSANRRFQREARALQRLAHPNIVPFYGLFQEEDLHFLLELFVDGPSLKTVLRKSQRRLSLTQILIILKSLGAALGYAHANGVVHCDVKPGNVMIDHSGQVFLTDFGVARHAESTTTTIGAAGTPAYMAPEQIRGEPVSAATDVYALGVLLYEMLAGRRPFTGAEADSESSSATAAERVRLAHLTQPAPDPRSFAPELPTSLAAVVLGALQKDSSKRYQSAQQFLAAVCEATGFNPANIPERLPASILAEYFSPPDERRANTEPVELGQSREKVLPVLAVTNQKTEKPVKTDGKKKQVMAGLISVLLVFSLSAGVFWLNRPDFENEVISTQLKTKSNISLSPTGPSLKVQTQSVPKISPVPSFTNKPTYTTLPTETAKLTETPSSTQTLLPTDKDALEDELMATTERPPTQEPTEWWPTDEPPIETEEPPVVTDEPRPPPEPT